METPVNTDIKDLSEDNQTSSPLNQPAADTDVKAGDSGSFPSSEGDFEAENKFFSHPKVPTKEEYFASLQTADTLAENGAPLQDHSSDLSADPSYSTPADFYAAGYSEEAEQTDYATANAGDTSDYSDGYRADNSGSAPSATSGAESLTYNINEAVFTDDRPYREEAAVCEYRRETKSERLCLILSILGLLLSVLVIPGIVFSIIGTIRSFRRMRLKTSGTLTWAFWLGVVGIVINFIFISSLILYILI